MQPQRYSEVPRRNIGWAVLSAILAIFSVVMIVTGDEPVVGWAGAVLFVPGTFLMAASVIRPPAIEIWPDRIHYTQWPNVDETLLFDEVVEFTVAPLPHGRGVGYRTVQRGIGEKVASTIADVDGMLPSTSGYGRGVGQLVDELERARQEHERRGEAG